MHELSYVDETFDLNFSLEYHLSIQINLDGFSFCILDIIQKKYVLLRYIPMTIGKSQFLTGKIQDIYENEKILNKNFKSVFISYDDQRATIIPSYFADTHHYEQVFELNQESGRNDEISSSKIQNFKQEIYFSYPKDIRSFFDSKYSEYHLSHSSYPLLNAAIHQKGKADKTLVLNFNKKYFQMVLLKNDIQLFNSFFYKTETDFLYHTLNICKRADFDAEKDDVLISGFVASDSNYIRQLKKYLLNLNFLSPDMDYHYSYTFEKTPDHYFAGLFNSYKCVL